MSDLLQFLLNQDQFRRLCLSFCVVMCLLTLARARLPSLFSDFTVQRHTNPDGFTANVNTWKDVLYKASLSGLIPGQDGSTRRFSLETGPHLLQMLESKAWGRPLALNAVIVGTYHFLHFDS